MPSSHIDKNIGALYHSVQQPQLQARCHVPTPYARPRASPPPKKTAHCADLAAIVGDEVVRGHRQTNSLDNGSDAKVEAGVCALVVVSAVKRSLARHVRRRLLKQIQDVVVVDLVPRARRRVRRQRVARIDIGAAVEGEVAAPPVQARGGVGGQAGHQRVVLVGGGDVRVRDVQVQHDEHVLLRILGPGAVVNRVDVGLAGDVCRGGRFMLTLNLRVQDGCRRSSHNQKKKKKKQGGLTVCAQSHARGDDDALEALPESLVGGRRPAGWGARGGGGSSHKGEGTRNGTHHVQNE